MSGRSSASASALGGVGELPREAQIDETVRRRLLRADPVGRRPTGYGAAVSPDDPLATATMPDGRRAQLSGVTWDHVLAGHPEMGDHLSDVIQTIEQPELREDDPRPGRIRHFRRCGPERWLRVVVEFGGEIDVVVTAIPQSNDPAGWSS